MVRRHEQLIETIAAAEVAGWPVGRPITLIEGMRAITLEVMLRAVIGAERPELLDELRAALADAVQLEALVLLMWAWPPLKRIGPWRAFIRRLGHARSLLSREIQRRRADPARESARTSCRCSSAPASWTTTSCSISSPRCCWPATTPPPRRSRGPWSGWCAIPPRSRVSAATRCTSALSSRRRCGCARCCPPWRAAWPSPCLLAGHTLPAGTTVMPCIRLLHLSPDLYPDPTSFRPERFLEGQGHGYAWIPFGGGTRRCIGACRRRTVSTHSRGPDLRGTAPGGSWWDLDRGLVTGAGAGCRASRWYPRAGCGRPASTGSATRRATAGSTGRSRSASLTTAPRYTSSRRSRASAEGWRTSRSRAHASAVVEVSWPASSSVAS